MSDLAHLEVDRRDEMVVVAIVGDVDASNGEEIGRQLDGAFERVRGRHVVDLTRTSYMDSVGLRLLFVIAERLRFRGRYLFVVVPRESMVRRVVELTGLEKLATVLERVADVPQE